MALVEPTWNTVRRAYVQIAKEENPNALRVPKIENVPSFSQEIIRLKGLPTEGKPQIIFSSFSLKRTSDKDMKGLGPPKDQVPLIERLADTPWGHRVTLDYSGLGVISNETVIELASQQEAINHLGSQNYAKNKTAHRSLRRSASVRASRDSGRIQISFHDPAATSEQSLAEGIYATVWEYFRQRRQDIHRKIGSWHQRRVDKGITDNQAVNDFASAMADEDIGKPGISTLPRWIVREARKIFSSKGTIPHLDSFINDWDHKKSSPANQAKFSIRRSTRKRNVKGEIRQATGQVKDTTPSNLTERQALQGILKSAERASKKGFRAGQVSIEANLQQAINFVKHNVPSIMQPKVIAALKGVRTLRGRKRVLQTVNRLQDQFEHTEALKKLEKTIKSVSGQKANKLLSEFRDQASGLLEGISLSSTSSAVRKRLDSLLRAARVGDEGIEGVSEARIKKVEGRLSEAGRKPIRNLTTEGVKELNQALSLLIQLNRLKKKLVFGNVIKEFQEFRNKIVNSLRGQRAVRLEKQDHIGVLFN